LTELLISDVSDFSLLAVQFLLIFSFSVDGEAR